MTGLLSGIPHLTRMIFAYFFSTFADSLLRSKRMSRTNVRKLAGATSTLLNGVFVLCLAFSGCSSNAAILFLTLSTAVHGAVSSGQLASLIDISPNYSGVTLGLNGMIAVWPGFISPYIVGKLTLGNVIFDFCFLLFVLISTSIANLFLLNPFSKRSNNGNTSSLLQRQFCLYPAPFTCCSLIQHYRVGINRDVWMMMRNARKNPNQMITFRTILPILKNQQN